jgi:hypothetical protein
MITKIVPTKASGVEFDVNVLQAESLDECRERWTADGLNADEVLLSIVNTASEQNAKQGAKDGVRKAIAAHGADSEAFDEAVEKAQSYASEYFIGKPRGGRLPDGSTKTELKEKAAAHADNPEYLERLNALIAEYES